MILHVDMDAFYAAVEQRDHPELRGQPVIVGGPASGRGVVSAASYEARQFGVHSALPTAIAKRRCPQGIFLPARMGHYAEISRHIREIFLRYTPEVEPLSLDEAFLDVRGSERLFGPPDEIGHAIRRAIREELNLIASVGIAPNKFLAKLASDLEKPCGFVVVPPDRIQDFLDPLPVERIWGVGKVGGRTFERMGIRTIAQLRAQDLATLKASFGPRLAHHLYRLARGLDERLVVPDQRAKSLSHETTFAEYIHDREVLTAWLLELADQVGARLRQQGLRGRTVHIKVRFADFKSVTRAHSLPEGTDVSEEIYDAARTLYEQRIDAAHAPIRLLGVGVSQLLSEEPRQGLLFNEDYAKHRQAEQATDAIRDRFGGQALARGTRLLHGTTHRRLPSVRDAPPESRDS